MQWVTPSSLARSQSHSCGKSSPCALLPSSWSIPMWTRCSPLMPSHGRNNSWDTSALSVHIQTREELLGSARKLPTPSRNVTGTPPQPPSPMSTPGPPWPPNMHTALLTCSRHHTPSLSRRVRRAAPHTVPCGDELFIESHRMQLLHIHLGHHRSCISVCATAQRCCANALQSSSCCKRLV